MPPGKGGGRRGSWYVAGAQWLLSVQRDDGGWSPDVRYSPGEASEVDTAFALLFLSRSPSAFHPSKPTRVDDGPATPSERDAPRAGR
jgi:hypothetical protein